MLFTAICHIRRTVLGHAPKVEIHLYINEGGLGLYIVYSLLILVLLVAVLAYLVFCIVRTVLRVQENRLKWHHAVSLGCVAAVALASVVFLGDYVYPFERKLEPRLFAEFDVPEEYKLTQPGEVFWRGAYEAYGLYAESLWFNPENLLESPYGFGWPPMNFDDHSYIITYGQKIESLSYNVWDTIDEPFRTGAKAGHMILDKEFSPTKVYIYEIPKLRIDNDINNPNNPWD